MKKIIAQSIIAAFALFAVTGTAGGYTITSYGAGSISDTINTASYRCVVDHGNWIYNAGVVEPAIPVCDEATGTPSGTPTPLHPQLTARRRTIRHPPTNGGVRFRFSVR